MDTRLDEQRMWSIHITFRDDTHPYYITFEGTREEAQRAFEQNCEKFEYETAWIRLFDRTAQPTYQVTSNAPWERGELA